MAAGWFAIPSSLAPYPKTHIPQTFTPPDLDPTHHHHHYFHHISSIPYLTHNLYTKIHDKDLEAHQPRADVRETARAFYLEIELPGVKEHGDVRLRWTDDRTLLLTSRTTRREIVEEGEGHGGAELVGEEPTVPATETAHEESDRQVGEQPPPPTAAEQLEALPKLPPTPKSRTLHLTVHERVIGEMVRGFGFPVEVDKDNTHARLEAGILWIAVPKVMHGLAATVDGEDEHLQHVPIRV